MRSAGVVKAEVTGERIPRLRYCVVGPQVYFFIFDGSPESLHEHIVAPCAPAIHADSDGLVDQLAGECGTGELAALVGIEDLRLAMASQGLLDRLDAELHRDRQPPGQNPPAEPVDDGGEIDKTARHGNVGQIHGPDLVGARDRQIAQQVRINLVPRRRLGGIWLAVNGLDPHALHQRGDMSAANLETLSRQQITQHAAAREGEIQMQLVHPAHQREISARGRPWQVINAAPADVQHPGLSRDWQIMRAVDHRFALGKPALPSAPAKKSFSSVSSPILAWSPVPSTAGPLPSVRLSDPNTPAAPSRSCAFHCVIWLG